MQARTEEERERETQKPSPCCYAPRTTTCVAMAGGFPDYGQDFQEEDIYIQYQEDDIPDLEQEDIYLQVQELVDDHNEDEEEEEDEDEEDSDYEEDEDDYNDDEDEGAVPPPPRVLVSSSTPSQEAAINRSSENVIEENKVNRRKTGGGETSSSQGNSKGGSEENASGGEWTRSDIEGLFCPICMEAWTNGGDHQVCCLPCGHLYGASCIKRWLQQHKNSEKCPQCNRKCRLKDVRVIYASQIVAVDHELPKEVRSLKEKCDYFKKKDNDWQKKEVEWRRTEADLHLQVHQLMERTSYLECLLGDTQNRPSGLLNASEGFQEQPMFGHSTYISIPNHGYQGSSSNFVLQKELQVDGAKFFDVDASNQIFVIARRLPGMGGTHVLSKMSLIAPHERENIQLPFSTKAVRDLRVAPHGRLTLLASLGKKLSVISTESNNIVLSYDLPAAAWSCSWDISSSHYIYTGLQNGMLLVFDMRQTLRPVESMVGLACNPIHSVHSLLPDLTFPSGVRGLLTASSVGLCQWNFGGNEKRPFLVPESQNQGVCIALAYSPSSNHIVASFRPKVEMSTEITVSQPSLTPVTPLMGHGVQGSHILYKTMGDGCYRKLGSVCANVNDVRLPKSAIIDIPNHNLQFASSNEVTCELVLQELPSFMVVQRLKSQKHPIRDVKYTHELSSGLLSCLSEDRLHLFSTKTS
ncbi:RING-type E3 ubiquitin transferase [Sarracenia purpurea var. burkii]